MLYRFTLSALTVADIQVNLRDTNTGSVTCRLYHLGEDGLAPEYYLGISSGQTCKLLVAVPAGNYQLDLSSSLENAAFTVVTKVGIGDGNDGLVQAESLPDGKIRSGVLSPNDLEDWYMFTVRTTSEEGVPYMVSTTAMEPTTFALLIEIHFPPA